MDVIVGFDAGMETVKMVMLRNGEIVHSSTVFTGIEAISKVAEKMLRQAIKKSGISADSVCSIVGTGANASDIHLIQQQVPEAVCSPLGINWVSPQACTLIDVGATKFVVMKCQQGRAIKISRSDKCASSVGISLKMVADILATNIESLGPMSMRSTEEVPIENTCSVFLETEIISLLHHYKKNPEDILRGVFRGMAFRFYSLLLRTGIEDDVYIIGGVAKNEGIVKALQDISGHRIFVPSDPNIVTALGAALSVLNAGVVR